MARPTKKGLDYFPFDVDIFNDEKIEAISGEFGIKGELAVIRLLCAVYREDGYFIVWNELKAAQLARYINASCDLVGQIIDRLVRWGFFDKDLFNSANVLTSVRIQKTYFEAIQRRKNTSGDFPYLLVSVCNNGVNVNINPHSTDINANINPQIKVNKSKVNNTINTNNIISEKNEEPINPKEERKKKVAPKKKEPKFDFLAALIELGVSTQVANDWMIVRSDKKASNTKTAFMQVKARITRAQAIGYSPDNCITIAVERSWAGFSDTWLQNIEKKNETNRPDSPFGRDASFAERHFAQIEAGMQRADNEVPDERAANQGIQPDIASLI